MNGTKNKKTKQNLNMPHISIQPLISPSLYKLVLSAGLGLWIEIYIRVIFLQNELLSESKSVFDS